MPPTKARRTYGKEAPTSKRPLFRLKKASREQAAPKFRAAVYFQDTIYTPVGLMKKPTALLTMSDEELQDEFRKEVVPIVEDRFGKGNVREMKLVQKLEGSGWAMTGFQMDGPGFSVEPRIFVYDPKQPFSQVLFRSYEAEKMQP